MNWRLATMINAAIALVTISAVVFDLTRSRPHDSHRQPDSGTSDNQPREGRDHDVAEINDLTNVRVDNLGAIAASELGQVMGRATPAEIAALALKFNDLPVDGHTLGGLGMFFQAWAELDPKAALTGAFQLKDLTLRKLAAGTVVGSVSPSAAPELTAMLNEHPDPDLIEECKNNFLNSLLERWAYIDPDAASKFLDGLGDTKNSLIYDASTSIAYAWGTLDPAAAFEWVEKQSKTGHVDGGSLYDEIIRGWCGKDLAAAANYVAQHLDQAAASGAISTVARAIFAQDASRATTWLSQLPPSDDRSNAESVISAIWAQKDPSAASRWVATLPQAEQVAIVGGVAGRWADANWVEASSWLATLTGDVRDQALAAVVNRDGAAPLDSLSLALGIKENELRSNVVQNLVRQWAANDAHAAEAWVRGSGLPSEEQEQLLSNIAGMQNAEIERVIVR